MAGAFFDRKCRTARHRHRALEDVALVAADLFYDEVVLLYLVIVRSVGDGGINQGGDRMPGLLAHIIQDILGHGDLFAADHIRDQPHLARSDPVILK